MKTDAHLAVLPACVSPPRFVAAGACRRVPGLGGAARGVVTGHAAPACHDPAGPGHAPAPAGTAACDQWCGAACGAQGLVPEVLGCAGACRRVPGLGGAARDGDVYTHIRNVYTL